MAALRTKYLRHGKFSRVRRNKDMLAFLAAEATALGSTASARTATPLRTTNTKAEGLLTIGGTVAALDTISIGGFTYTFVTALTQAQAASTLTFGANAGNGKKVTIASRDYTFKTALTEVKASNTITSNNTNVSDGATVVVNGKTYTLQSTLTEADGHVHIGADADSTLLNLARAINKSGGTAGTDYANAMVANADVTASATVTAHAITLTAKVPGVAGNAFTLSFTGTNHYTAGGATFSLGVDPVVNEVFIGADASGSLDNIIAAVNHASGSGSTYSTGTVVDANVTAAAGAGDTAIFTAIAIGTLGNGITFTTDIVSATFNHAAAVGGVAPVANEVIVGNGTTGARDNLVAAVNGGAGSGSTYSTGTASVPKVVATTSSGNVLLTAADVCNIIPGQSVALVSGSAAITCAPYLDGPSWAATAHGFGNGEGPVLLTNSGGALPAGSPAAGTDLYVHKLDADHFALATSRSALGKGFYIQTTDAGTGTHSVTRRADAQGIYDTLKKAKNVRTISAATDIDTLK